MLSILIPCYNYNITDLVFSLVKMCEEETIPYEIIIGEDAVSSDLSTENLKLNDLKNINYYLNSTNLGRAKNRNELVKKSKYDLLLFLDADTFPVQSDFLKNYLDFYNRNNSNVIFGGLKYQVKKPEPAKTLRWVYGKKREALDSDIRKKDPFKRIFASNLLIKKEIMERFPFDNAITMYGNEDTIFFKSLKHHQVSVEHIENPVYHLGIEENQIYLRKFENSLKNLKTLMDYNKLDKTDVKIIEKYYKLKKFGLLTFFVFFYKSSRFLLLKNLNSRNPNLFLFDLYRLGYLSSLK